MWPSPISPLPPSSPYWGGHFRAGPEARFVVHDPWDGRVIAEVPRCGHDEAVAAVEAAVVALRAGPPALVERARWLQAVAALHEQHVEALARVITAENGKPLAEAEGEVRYAASFYRDAARRLPELEVRRLPDRPRGCTWEVHARPAGVAALITPFNFPLAMLAKKLAGAWAAGCPVVIKPAEKTPLSAMALVHLLHTLDLPPGWFNLVTGEAEAIGRAWCAHPAVRVVSFTGSTAVGQLLAAWCAPGVKRLALELGGNAPLLVFADADLDAAAAELVSNKLRCAGQTCVCANRVLVQAEVLEPFAERVQRLLREVKVGRGDAPGVQLGPLIDARGAEKVRRHVDDAVARGAALRLDGAPRQAGGTSWGPTLLVGLDRGALIGREETFGPVFALGSFADEADAVDWANDTPHGLAAYVFSGDRARLQRVAGALRCGHVGLNTATGPTAEAPFGGVGLSGLGREGGLEGVLEFVEWQSTPLGPGAEG